MAASERVDVNSGVARHSGVIWATHWTPEGTRPDTVVLIVHPASNFMGHYLLKPLADAGVPAVGLATRYLGNDQMLLMENCVLDIGAAIDYLRTELGYQRVILIGNSGGGGLAAMYQSQAEHPTITATPAGDGPDLTRAGLTPADELVMLMALDARVTVIYGSGDDAAFPSHAQRIYDSVRHERRELICLDGANHYFIGQPGKLAELVERLTLIARGANRREDKT